MNDLFVVSATIVSALIVGFLLGRWSMEKHRKSAEEFRLKLARQESEATHLERRLSEQKAETERIREQFTREFEILAQKILEEKSVRFTEQNRQQITRLLDPLQEKIATFEKRIEDTHKQSIDYHAALREQILGLRQMNELMTRETVNLTRALKGDAKMQGNWGEMILERVLEKSGLEKGREYEVQKGHTDDSGSRVFPDVVVHLPDGKKLIIDSKVSLLAYERYVNEEEEANRPALLREHLASIRRHVDLLGSKNYQDLYDTDSPDFVLLFIPIEPAFALALREDAGLYTKAFDRNIVIVTPSTLLATLRTIDSIWTNAKQQQNAYEIARMAGSLYDKFQGFVGDLERIGKKIDESRTEYENARNKLFDGKGNVIVTVEKLKKLGAKARKSLPANLLNDTAEEPTND